MTDYRKNAKLKVMKNARSQHNSTNNKKNDSPRWVSFGRFGYEIVRPSGGSVFIHSLFAYLKKINTSLQNLPFFCCPKSLHKIYFRKGITKTLSLACLFVTFLLPITAFTTPKISLPSHEIKIINEVADEYNLTGESRLLLFVIRKVENGGSGREFGVLHPKAINTTFRNQAQWAAGTIKKRYAGDLKAFAQRWCPIGAENDPQGLNKNWYKNADYYMKKWGEK